MACLPGTLIPIEPPFPFPFPPFSCHNRFTAEGFEETIGVNHFGHFLLAQRLLGASRHPWLQGCLNLSV